MRKLFGFNIPVLVAGVLSAGIYGIQADAQSGATEGIRAIYGMAIDPDGPKNGAGSVFIATDYGLLRAKPNDVSTVVQGVEAAVVGLAAAPNNPERLFLSGIDKDGNPVGMLTSQDGGQSWAELPSAKKTEKIAAIALSISRLSPNRMISLNKVIRRSSDFGASWSDVTVTPEKTISAALSAVDENRLFAATASGLMVSNDGGRSWTKSFQSNAPASVVVSLSGGRVMAFVFGLGLIVANEHDLVWSTLATGFEDRYLLNLIEDPDNSDLLYATADTGAILLSRDGGQNWASFEGSDMASPERIAEGQQLFEDNCQACHGVKGAGESPDDPTARDAFGFKAPALNNDMHAWHHSDTGLRKTIHVGSPRNERMIAWKDQLSNTKIDSILVYLKSLWSVRSLACQGGRHMACK